MIWAILALLGVPVWLCVLAIAILILRNRALRHREGNLPVRVRKAGGKRWSRGNAVWIHDVFASRGFPAAWKEVLIWVSAAEIAPAAGDDLHKLRRLDSPLIATLTSEDGDVIEVAAAGGESELLRGPFALASGPHAPSALG
jgi:hypothetical protein